MPRERSLLERLRDPEGESARTIHENPARLAESVLANLRSLLNSRPGMSSALPEYGIPDLSDIAYSMPDSAGRMRNAIRTAIERYEPRLRRVTVKYVSDPMDPLTLRFDVTAELVTNEARATVQFETRYDPTGRVSIKD